MNPLRPISRLPWRRRLCRARILSACGALALLPLAPAAPLAAELVEVRKIWDEGRHNAFTDLLRWNDRWWCTFREAEDHVGGDGAIRVLTSADGREWKSAARLTERGIDLRDPKLSVMPDGRLMLNCGGSVYEGRTLKGRRSRVMFSRDGHTWTAPQPLLEQGDWLWRVTWHEGVAYGAAYRALTGSGQPGPEWLLNLYRSRDGVSWELLKRLDVTGQPNETTLRFERDGTMVAMVRRESGDRLGRWGRAKPPFETWTWQPGNHRFGGQNFLQLPSGEWVAGTRDYTQIKPRSTSGARTLIAQVEDDGRLTPLVTLPSDGDTSYPGLVWHDGLLWVSYYSSHEGKSAIYLARIRLGR